MDVFKRTALFSSFFVFNFVSTTYPLDKVVFPKPTKAAVRLETKVENRDMILIGTKKQVNLNEEVKIGAKKKTYVDKGIGVVTYYGDALHGRRTSSGEVFDMNAYTTAASPEYAFGTILKVTNIENGNSIEVKVNDRGAFYSRGISLDLSKAAFAELSPLSRGVLKVKIDIVK